MDAEIGMAASCGAQILALLGSNWTAAVVHMDAVHDAHFLLCDDEHETTSEHGGIDFVIARGDWLAATPEMGDGD
jgi:hypothetical protein